MKITFKFSRLIWFCPNHCASAFVSLSGQIFFFCCSLSCLLLRVCVENRHTNRVESMRACEVTMLLLQPKIGCWIVRWLLPLDKIPTSTNSLLVCPLYIIKYNKYNRRQQKKENKYQHNHIGQREKCGGKKKEWNIEYRRWSVLCFHFVVTRLRCVSPPPHSNLIYIQPNKQRSTWSYRYYYWSEQNIIIIWRNN